MCSLFPQAAAIEPGATYAQVALHRGIERAGGRGASPHSTLTYRVPPALTGDAPARVGQLVTVPLGKGNKPATGVIVALGGPELPGGLDAGKVKSVLSITPAVLPARLLDLAQWISEYYVCPLGMVLLTMLPAAVKKQVGRKAVTVLALGDQAKRFLAEHAEGAEEQRRQEGERGEKTRKGSARAPTPRAADVKLQAAWVRVLALDAELWPLTARALCANVEGLKPSMVKRLVAAGALTESVQTLVSARADPLLAAAMAGPAGGVTHRAPTLTPDQARVVGAIMPTLDRFGVHVIRGVTGSGKTEVYLRLIQDLLSRDAAASAIVLVPEIALTPQTARRFLDRFGAGTVAVLHSALSESQRHAQWEAAAAGRVRVVVGARSAIFAPLPNLRLIVVDEEHDTSYKQDQLPRYHARDVAVKRAQTEGCCVLLGSATPSLETYANTAGSPGRAAKYVLHELPVRVGASALPTVRIVDLMDERRLRATKAAGGWQDRQLHLIGPTLETEIDRTLRENGQAILLLNRRGFANYLCCPSPACGFVMHCDHCDATVVYHRGEQYHASGSAGFVRCHHCLAEVRLPELCPSCKAKRLNTFGLGTQRVEEELERTFAHHGLASGDTLLRIDSDTMHTARDYFTALGRFADGRARVLLGTQMIAKGLDFPNVRLVGIVNADTALALPDFRAYERTFQLVCQVAGRAGRREAPGLVIVQTVHPHAPPIVLAARHDYPTFARDELRTRTQAGLPPATRMARIVCRDLSHAKATRAAADLAQALREAIGAQRAPAGAIVLRGPMPAPIARIDDHHRIVIELMATGRGIIQAVMADVRARGLLTSDAHTAVDVDPISLM